MAGKRQRAGLHHLVEPVHAGGGLLGDAADVGGNLGPLAGVGLEVPLQQLEDDAPLLGVVRLVERRHRARRLVLGALVDQQRGVAAVVEQQGRAGAVGPLERLLGAPPVLLQRLTLPGVDRHAARFGHGAVRPHHDGRGRVVLGREDVAADPAHVGAELGQGLDQHGGLHRHVERAHDLGALQRLLALVLLAERHQAGHLELGEADLVAAPLGERDVGHLVGLAALRHGSEGVLAGSDGSHDNPRVNGSE